MKKQMMMMMKQVKRRFQKNTKSTEKRSPKNSTSIKRRSKKMYSKAIKMSVGRLAHRRKLNHR